MIGTLTVGLGAFAVVYTVVDKVLIEPLPYERPDDLYVVWRDYTWVADSTAACLAGTDVLALRGAGGAIEDVAAIRRSQRHAHPGGRHGSPRRSRSWSRRPNLFRMLGVRPALGRTFAPDEDGRGPRRRSWCSATTCGARASARRSRSSAPRCDSTASRTR